MRPMRQVRQRGMLMLTVALMLAVLGALAFSMTREAAMAAQGIESQYDIETARYLAGAAMTLAQWQNEQAGCGKNNDVAVTQFAGAGAFSAVVSKSGGNALKIVASGVTPSGASRTVTHDNVVVHDLSKQQTVILGNGGGNSDTYLSADQPALAPGGSQYLELTQGHSVALVQFSMGPVKPQSLILTASLKLFQFQSVSGGTGQPISVHRVTRQWDAPPASWLTAKPGQLWTAPGGDYDPAAIASATTSGNNTMTAWDVWALVDGWSNGPFGNSGLLLRADGPMQQVRFASFENPSYADPSISVTFVPPC